MIAISINNLEKTYKNGIRAVKGIDLEVESGDFFALLGQNGAGKSTTINIISSLVNKSSGKVEVFGKNIDTDKEKVKSFLGLVPQEFNFNIFEEVIDIVVNQAGYYGLPRENALKRAEFFLKKLNLWEKRNERSMSLSGGMKRKLMIARALVHKPKILILDEPTAGVDVETRRSMWEFLKELNNNGTTIILTTHYLEEAEHLCKNIAIINKGKIVENTSMKSLLSTLDNETFILDLTKPIKIIEIPGYKIKIIDSTTIEVDLKKKQNVNRLIGCLTKKGIIISSLRNKSNRLEELFISLTGNGEKRGKNV